MNKMGSMLKVTFGITCIETCNKNNHGICLYLDLKTILYQL